MGGLFALLGMLATVVLVLALAWAASRWIGAWGASAAFGPGGGAGIGFAGAPAGGEFRILGQIAVGRNERLLLVRLRESCCLLGVTANRITLLKEWEGSEAEAWFTGTAEPPPDFLAVLRETVRKTVRRP